MQMPRDLYSAPVSPGARLVLALLWSYARPDDRFVWPAMSTLAGLTGFDPRSLRRIVNELAAAGLLVRGKEAREGGARRGFVLLGERTDGSPKADRSVPRTDGSPGPRSPLDRTEESEKADRSVPRTDGSPGPRSPLDRTEESEKADRSVLIREKEENKEEKGSIEPEQQELLTNPEPLRPPTVEELLSGRHDGKAKRSRQANTLLHQGIFDAFAGEWPGRGRVKLNADRKSRIKKALADYEPSQVTKALLGNARSRFWRGEESPERYRNGMPPTADHAFKNATALDRIETAIAAFDNERRAPVGPSAEERRRRQREAQQRAQAELEQRVREEHDPNLAAGLKLGARVKASRAARGADPPAHMLDDLPPSDDDQHPENL